MKVLIVFENVPETTDLFIVEANEEDLKDLRLSHGNYINSVDNEDIENAISRVNLRLGSPNDYSAKAATECGLAHEEVGKWDGSAVDTGEPILVYEGRIEMVVVTGFIM